MLKKFFIAAVLLIAVCLAYYQFWFLRQPDRTIPNAADAFISPANGEVAAIVHWTKDSLAWEKDAGVVQVMTSDVDSSGWLIAIEMDVTNVHFQRAPMAAKFLKNEYVKGRFNNALVQTNRYGLRLENERNDLLFEAENGMKFKVVQVAGLLARRIVDFVEPDQGLAAGEVIGLIKLGSQVGLILPEGTIPNVTVGQTVIDGETIIAKVKK
ncbi:MAG: phosphatidylserine decarboxylase [Saprospiraceae bacterium]|jgi:phosphatidylserine decarboxylase|nr:phosphatidylserine decarboxylase [Saprospiraceae bacterium]